MKKEMGEMPFCAKQARFSFSIKIFKKVLTTPKFCGIIIWSHNDTIKMEKSRSWSSAHDWKSCNRQKRFESSNLSFSAKKDRG